jgi:DHA1 family tetracycline resistance protein-like MFS transporter
VTADKRILLLCSVAAADTIGYGIVLPLIPFFGKSLNASPLQIAITIAVYPLAQIGASPLVGWLSDLIGRRKMIVIGLIVAIAGYLLFAIANQLLLLILSRVVLGIAGSNYAVLEAYIADVTTPDTRTSGMGWVGAAYGVGIVIGPALGGLLVPYGWSVPGLVAAALCAANGIFAFALLPDSESGRAPTGVGLLPWRATLDNCLKAPLRVLIIISVLANMTFAAVTAILPIHLSAIIGLTASGAGLLWTWAGIVMVAARATMVGRMARSMGERHVIQIGLTSLIAALIGYCLVKNFTEAMVATTFLCFGSSLVFPSLISLVSQSADDASLGSTLGNVQSFAYVASIVGPLWAGLAFQSIGAMAPYAVGCLLLSAALVVTLWGLPHRETNPVPATE